MFIRGWDLYTSSQTTEYKLYFNIPSNKIQPLMIIHKLGTVSISFRASIFDTCITSIQSQKNEVYAQEI